MICQFCEIGDYNGFCHCSKNNDICVFMRRCQNEHKWKPLESMDKCKLRKEGTLVPKGMNKVRFELKGVLYVEVGDFVHEIKNPYDHTPEFVEIVQADGKYYIKGFAPEKKRQAKKIAKDEEPSTK
jgi:hypothetical protein